MSASIFISFAAKDQKVANTLCQALEGRGFKCWISSRDIQPGENFQVAIVRAIRDARMMLLVFTANSNTSEEMTKELALASQNKLIVVPLRIEDVTPNEAFSYEFATRQWIDFFADWEAAMDQLSRRIASALGPEARAPGLAAAAPPGEPAVAAPLIETQAPAPRKSRLGVLVAIGTGLLILAGAAGLLAPALLAKKAPVAPPSPAAPARLVASTPAAPPTALAAGAAPAETAGNSAATDEAPRPKPRRKPRAAGEESSDVPTGDLPF